MGTILRHSGATIATVAGLLFLPFLFLGAFPERIAIRIAQLRRRDGDPVVDRPMLAPFDGRLGMPIGPWQGLGVAFAWALGALAIGYALLRARDVRPAGRSLRAPEDRLGDRLLLRTETAPGTMKIETRTPANAMRRPPRTRHEPVRQRRRHRCRRDLVVVAGREGDRREERDADRAADLLRRVDEPRGEPGLLRLRPGQRRDGDRHERERDRDAEDEEAREEIRPVRAVDGDLR